MNTTKIEFCGAFQCRTTLKPGETLDQAAQRVEYQINRILDAHGKRLEFNAGVDFGDIKTVL